MGGYGFENVRVGSYDELMRYVSEEDIMTYYYGEWEPDRHHKCPFKPETMPSFYISYYNQQLKWRRFGMYNSPKNPVEFVMIKYNLGFYDALNKIYQDIYLGNVDLYTRETISQIRSQAKDQIHSSIVIKDWDDYDLDFWLAHDGFSIERLEKFMINAASEYWANDIRSHVSSARDPLYCYNHGHETGLPSFTAYRPYADLPENIARRSAKLKDVSQKFKKYMIRGHIMNFNTLIANKSKFGVKDVTSNPRTPELANIVFITKSLKDIVALDCVGIDSCAPHSEEGVIPDSVLDQLAKYYDHIYIMYDNDETGVTQSLKITSNPKYNLKYCNVPKGLSAKDPAGVLLKGTIEVLQDIIYDKLHRDKVLL